MFGLGCGLMRTKSAYEKLATDDSRLQGWIVKVPNQGVGAGTANDRGIYWRDASKANTVTTVRIGPVDP